MNKFGIKRGKQRYKCKICGYVFQNNSRKKESFVIWKDYTEGKQTYEQLAKQYGLSIPTIKKKIDEIIIKKKSLKERKRFG